GIWNVIVSLMNNVIVPWLGDVMGQSSGLPTSFTQRPYDYPDLFVAIIELCVAGLVAVAINAYFQKPRRVQVRAQKRVISQPSVAPTQVVPVVTTTPAPAPAPTVSAAAPSIIPPPAVIARPSPPATPVSAPVVAPPLIRTVPTPQPAPRAVVQPTPQPEPLVRPLPTPPQPLVKPLPTPP